ncbi:unnamed protein product [Bursaphelenchus okinawaensis]|uniref:RING-type domain-containing protein n=1 Tax=Bursaphelenchus okinawaensis TaxID=465554 RepID=A0A811LEN2_9BILA|nr:unnamed protein product [Bursaphelenchus okinawaensis]CAG9121184.1 unnamed protein product [Bursaphelenchus okinawaensis]
MFLSPEIRRELIVPATLSGSQRVRRYLQPQEPPNDIPGIDKISNMRFNARRGSDIEIGPCIKCQVDVKLKEIFRHTPRSHDQLVNLTQALMKCIMDKETLDSKHCRYSVMCLAALTATVRLNDIDNDVCTICLEDPSVKPVFCLLCEKVIGCNNCIKVWLDESPDMVRCLRCQRYSLKIMPLIRVRRPPVKIPWFGHVILFFLRWLVDAFLPLIAMLS